MIGVFGGTFDPIHFGHLRPALDIMEQVGMEQLRFIPCGQPPHRGEPLSGADLRLAMVRAATVSVSGFVVDDREILRQGPSYMVDTLTSLQQDFPTQTLSLIVGRDAFNHFPQWHRWEQLFELAHIVVMSRPQRKPAQANPQLEPVLEKRLVNNVELLHSSRNGLVIFCEVTQLDISATKIRAMVRQGNSPEFLLPEAVLQLIRENALYR